MATKSNKDPFQAAAESAQKLKIQLQIQDLLAKCPKDFNSWSFNRAVEFKAAVKAAVKAASKERLVLGELSATHSQLMEYYSNQQVAP